MTIHEFPKKIELSEKERLEREELNARNAERDIELQIELITGATWFYMTSLLLESKNLPKMPDEISARLVSCAHDSIHALVSNFFGKETPFQGALDMIYDLKEELTKPPQE